MGFSSALDSPSRSRSFTFRNLLDATTAFGIHHPADPQAPRTLLLIGSLPAQKLTLAQQIHQVNREPDSRFISVDCGRSPERWVESLALGEGWMARASQVTLYLSHLSAAPVKESRHLLAWLHELQSTMRFKALHPRCNITAIAGVDAFLAGEDEEDALIVQVYTHLVADYLLELGIISETESRAATAGA